MRQTSRLGFSVVVALSGIRCSSPEKTSEAPSPSATVVTPVPTASNSPPEASVPTYAYFFSDWRECGSINGVPKGGGTPTLVWEQACTQYGSSAVDVLAFDASNLYVGLSGGSIRRLGRIDDQDSLLVMESTATDTAIIDAIASNGVLVFFSFENNEGSYLLSISPDGGAVQSMTDTPSRILSIAADDAFVYWTEQDLNQDDAGAFEGTVRRMPVDGGAIESLATAQSQPQGLAVDSTGIYWMNQGPYVMDCQSYGTYVGHYLHGAVMKLATGSTAPQALATELLGLQSIARSDGAVYWAVDDNPSCTLTLFLGHVDKLSDGITTPIQLATGLASPTGLYVDDTWVYYQSTDSTLTNVAIGVAAK
jgi:hypothetical protein